MSRRSSLRGGPSSSPIVVDGRSPAPLEKTRTRVLSFNFVTFQLMPTNWCTYHRCQNSKCLSTIGPGILTATPVGAGSAQHECNHELPVIPEGINGFTENTHDGTDIHKMTTGVGQPTEIKNECISIPPTRGSLAVQNMCCNPIPIRID